ncbi:MAG: hypothetical protein IJ725_03765 [Ruminococcus sp.]|nr:hypothetical protein [Ruminococcus sp.]
MRCLRCGSNNVLVQVVNEPMLKNDYHGCLWWIFVGWWWVPVKWICLTVPALFAKIFIPHRKKIVNKNRRIAVCQSCGHTWRV